MTGEKLEGPLFALALLPALGILGFVAHPIHKNEGLTRAFLVLIALAMALVVSYGAYEMAVTAQGLSSSDHLPPEAFIPRGETADLGPYADLGPFRVALEEVDTLKKKKVPRPWQWNRSTFGDEALSDFLVNSRVRISRDFKVDDPDDTKWPTPEQFMRVDSEDEWTKLLEPLKAKVESRWTRKSIALDEALSKWPLARIKIIEVESDQPPVDRFYPAEFPIPLTDDAGRHYSLCLAQVYNGDRDLGESEAVVVRISRD